MELAAGHGLVCEPSQARGDVVMQSASSADSTETPATNATAEKYLQEQIIHAYGNGPYNYKQKEARL